MHAAVLQSTALPIVLLSLLVYVFVRRFSFSFSFYVILHVLLSLSVSVIGLELTKRLFHHDCSGVHTPRRPSTPFVQIQRQSQNLISPSFFHSSRRHLSPSYTTSSSLISSSSSSPSILSFSSSFSQSRLPTHSQFLTPSLSDPLRGRQSPSVCKNLFFLSSFPSWVHKRVSRVASFSPCSSSSSSSSSPSHLHKRVLSSPSFFFESNRKGGVYTLEKRRSSSRQLPSFSRIIQKTPENKPSQSYSFISHPFISLQPFFTSFLSPLIACKTSSSSSSPPRHSFVTHKPHQTQNVSISQGIVSLSLSPRPVFFFGTVFLSHPHLPRHRIPTPPSYKECTRASTQLLTSSITPSSQDGHYLVQHVNEKSESSTERKPFPPRLLRLLQALRDQRTVKECLDLLLSYGSRLPKPGEDRGRGFSSLSSSVSQRKEERIERSDEKDGRQNTITLSTLEEGTASNRNEKTLLSSSSSCDSSWWIERIDSCSAFVLLNVQLLPYPYRRAHDEDQKKEKKREEEEKATVEREDSSCVKEDEKEEEDLTKEEEKDDRTECGPLNGVERQEERCQQEEKEGEDGRDYREAKKRQGIFEELDKVPRRSFLSPVTDEEEDEDIRCLTAQQPRKPKVYVHLKSWSDSALLRGWLYILQEGLSNTEHSAEEVLELEVKEVLKAAGITPQSHHQVQADNRISGVRTVANESFPKSSITIPEDVEPWVRQAKQWKGKGLSSRKDFSSLLINAPFLSSEEKKTEKQDLSMLTPGRIEVEEEEQGENKETNSSAEDLAEGFEEREEQKEGVEKGQIRTDRGQREGSGQTKKGEDERHEEDERDHKEDLKQEDIRRLLLPIGFVPVFKSIQREVHRQLADLSGVRTPSNPVCRLAAGVVDEPTNDGNADASSGVPSSHHVKSSTSPLVKTYPSSSSSILSSPSSSFSPSSSCSSVSRSSVLRRFRFPLPRVSTPSKGHGREEVAVLLSGGVDSSVSLRLLQEQGYRVRAYFIKIWLPEELLLLRRIQGEHRSTPRHFTRSSSSFSLSKDGQPFPVAMKANQRNEGQLVKEEGENVEAIDEEEKKTQESCCSVSRDKREEEERRQTTPMMMNVEDRSRHSRSRERICGVWEKDYQSAKDVCDQLNVRLNVLPLQEAYWDRVVHQMLKDAKSGLTPNPDWWCNKRVKFGRFVDLLDSQDQAFLDLPSIASGHYARVLDDGDIQKEDEEEEEGRAPRPPGGRESTRRRRRLFRGKDPRKDQSYFLSGLTAQQLSRLITPVGNLHKFE
ncbi:trna methyl transferase, partial [Cystoisospora suis]